MLLQSLFNKSTSKQNMQYAKMLSGQMPIFSQYGQNIYYSDVVQMCIDRIATEMSKLQPKHIYVNGQGLQTIPNSSINGLFKFAPNELMTMSEFIEKCIWQLFMNYNLFILPIYDTYTAPNGNTSRVYTALYPLNPLVAEFLQDATGTFYAKLTFSNGENYTILYSDLIHIRKKFSINDFMGGGADGQPDNTALLKTLDINDTVLDGLGKAIKTSLTVRGVVKINTMIDDDAAKAEIAKLESAIDNGTSGILPLDLKGDYTPLDINPKIIDKDTMDFLQNKILNWYGVSIPILSGEYSDDQYNAFYESTLEPIIIRLGQAFSNAMFSTREQQVGNSIAFYPKDMQFLSMNSKLNLIKIAGEQGLMTINEKLAILGMPPIDGGDVRTISLNHVDTNIANEYQLNRANAPQINMDGGNANE